jgi:hypothetical protein
LTSLPPIALDRALAEEQIKHFRHELRVVLKSLDAIYGPQDE